MSMTSTQLYSLRGPGPWKGLTTTSRSERGDYRFADMVGCYISVDGQEVRTFPGTRCVLDPQSDDVIGTTGYERLVLDAWLPVYSNTASSPPYYKTTHPDDATSELWVQAPLVLMHGFEFLHDRLVLFGETSFRREPIYNVARTTFVTVESWASGANTVLTLSEAIATTAELFNSLDTPGGTVAATIYLEGLTGTDSDLLNGKFHTLVAIGGGGTTVEITTPTGTNGVAQTGSIWRTRPILTDSAGQYRTPGDADFNCIDYDALTAFWAIYQVDPDNTSSTIHPSYVANRQRDFGDVTGFRREGLYSTDRSRRGMRAIDYRPVSKMSGSRVLLSIAGYGCTFQIPAVFPVDPTGLQINDGIPWTFNDVYDKPRCIGLPKAVILENTHLATNNYFWSPGSATNAFGGSDASVTARNGVYQFRVAYKDDATGEVGIWSEAVSVTTDTSAAFLGIELEVVHPGYFMPECLAFSVLVYRTELGGSTFYYVGSIAQSAAISSKYGLDTSVVNTMRFTLRVPYSPDSELILTPTSTPTIQQLPRGSNTNQTVRAYTLYGGSGGIVGERNELFYGEGRLAFSAKLSATPNSNFPYQDRLYMEFGKDWATQRNWMIGSDTISPAYTGAQVLSNEVFPHPRSIVVLDKLNNQHYSGNPVANDIKSNFSLRQTPLGQNVAYDVEDRCYLRIHRGIYQISEATEPGTVPATSNGLLDSEQDDDIEASGAFGGNFVVMSTNRTYVIPFADSPVESGAAKATIASSEHGCIAGNSVVEFDGGLVWIGKRGPVAMTSNGTSWVGQNVVGYFTESDERYLRDTKGMMRHAIAVHDQERGLVVFGLYADTHETEVTLRGLTTTWEDAPYDATRSKWPCDELLVWSYRADAWTRVPLPEGALVRWMRYGRGANGKQYVYVLCDDNRIYVLGDEFGDQQLGNQAMTVVDDVTASATFTFALVDPTPGDGSAAFLSGRPIHVGQSVLVLGEDQDTVLHASLVASYDMGSASITMTDAGTFPAGSKVLLGYRTMRLVTNYVSPRGPTEQTTVKGIPLRYRLTGAAGSRAFARATVRANRHEPSEGVTERQVGFTDETEVGQWQFLGTVTDGNDMERSDVLRLAEVGGQSFEVTLEVIGDAQMRLVDLAAEIG